MGNEKIQWMQQRCSRPRLMAPAPTQSDIQQLISVATRTPDHAMLKPWRYLVVEGRRLKALGELFCQAAERKLGPLTPEAKERFSKMPERAPMIIIGIASTQEHPKVPVIEQVISAGVGMGYILLALEGMGYGGMWRTGDMAYDEVVHEGLGLAKDESVVGFLYVGTPEGPAKKLETVPFTDVCRYW